jgi:hypothetical protein
VGYSPDFTKRHQGTANFFSNATPTPGCTIVGQIGVITINNSTASRSGRRDRRRNGRYRDLPGSDDEGHHPTENRRKLLGVDATAGERARGHSAEGAQNRNFHPSKSAREIEKIDQPVLSVLQDCSPRFVSKDSFQKFTAVHPEFYRELVTVLSMRLRETDRALVATPFLSGKGRQARVLLNLAEYLGQPSGSDN